MTEIAVAQQAPLAVRNDQSSWTTKQKQALLALGVHGGRTDHGYLPVEEGDWLRYLAYCQRTQLDPFANQIYMIARFDKNLGRFRQTIQVGIDGLRVIAERTRTYEGQTPTQWCGPDGKWKDVWLDPGNPAAARVGVYRKGFREPLYAVALWREFTGDNAMWRSKGSHMLAKVAEALALRKAFPQDLSGLYIEEEMHQADNQDPSNPEATQAARTMTSTQGAAADNSEEVVDLLAAIEAATSVAHLVTLWNADLADAPTGPLDWGEDYPHPEGGTVKDAFTWKANKLRAAEAAQDEAGQQQETPEDTPEGDGIIDAEVVHPEAPEPPKSTLTAEKVRGMSKTALKAAYRDSGTPWEKTHDTDLGEAREWLIQVLGL